MFQIVAILYRLGQIFLLTTFIYQFEAKIQIWVYNTDTLSVDVK